MSDTESIVSPPPHEFQPVADGVTMWRAEFDGISVRRVFSGVCVEAFRGDQRLVFTLSNNHAAHLGRLLLREAAE